MLKRKRKGASTPARAQLLRGPGAAQAAYIHGNEDFLSARPTLMSSPSQAF